MILGIVFGVVISVVNTRLLGPEVYGDYKFIHSVYSFFTIVIGFGFLQSVGKMLAEKKNEALRKELIGSSVLITVMMGCVFAVIMLIFAVFQKHFFPTDLSGVILMLTPVLFFVPFNKYFENVFQGDNKIYELAIFRQLPQLMYLVSVIIMAKFGWLNLISALYAQLTAFILVEAVLLVRLKPYFKNLKKNIKYIYEDTKTYGFHVYLGTLFGVASTSFAPVVLSYFSDSNVSVGYFSLAITVTAPLMMIPSVVGTTMFKEFANSPKIPAKATYATLGSSLVTLLLFLLIIKPVIIFLYTDKFIDVVPLAYIVSIAQILHGYGNYYNRFLGAHGLGKKLRNGAFLVGISNLAGFVFLVPAFGAYGAAFTKLSSGLVFVVSMYIYYIYYTRSNKFKA
ncbi:MAG: oligosaccharide flippase family protein [Candidatus Delongbacteria bacterium]|nr:oligosaccharide flippase family protein [Candidatus Delongbacteria bacterium]